MGVAEQVVTERERVSIWERPLWMAMAIDWEKVLVAGIFVAAVVSRLWMVGARVMSHDESLHTEYSWYLFKGRGFQHTPLMHGTFQMHIIALFYWLFGDNDTTSRLPAALFGIALVMFPLLLRRWLGRTGALATSFLLLISPSILYYARYTRNEAFVLLEAAAMVWAFLRYEQTREAKWLYVLAAATSLLFTTKEVSYIYVGIFLLFLVIRFVLQALRGEVAWTYEEYRRPFSIAVAATLALGAITGIEFLNSGGMGGGFSTTLTILLTLTAAAGIAAIVLVLLGIREEAPAESRKEARFALPPIVLEVREGIRKYASLELILVFATLILPQFSALLVKRLGWDPLDYTDAGIIHSATVVVPLLLLTLLIGAIWDWRRWLIAAGIFYAIFITLYTTVFTNPQGLASGLMGSLGYWMVQQGVKRGDQPWYYYLIVTPLYEFLPLILGMTAIIYYGARRWTARAQRRTVEWADGAAGSDIWAPFSAWWLVMSFVLYSYAGEKMPWLMVHLTLPAVFLAGWLLGQFLTTADWRTIARQGGWAVALLLVLIGFAWPALVGSRPFQSQEQQELARTAQWLSSLLIIAAALVGVYLYWQRMGTRPLLRVAAAAGILGLVVLTVRTAWRANYINYDNTREFLVYAHGAPAVKQVMAQVEEISQRMTGGLDLKVAFEEDTAWPFTWYLRNYPNQRYMGASASSDVRNYPVVIVGDKNYAKFDPYLKDTHYKFEYIFLWWPMEDYKNLTWERIRYALTNPEMRAAVWDIIFNRDYEKYGQLTGGNYALSQWPLRHSFRLYLDKKIAAQLWDHTVGPVEPIKPPEDPHAKTKRDIAPIQVWGTQGSGEGQFNRPRNLAIGPDGFIYVVDTDNHRVQKFDAQGHFVKAWGSMSPKGNDGQPILPAPPGTFTEPWGIAVDKDGNVYVADTWNHRIQKFTSDGVFLKEWGTFGTPGVDNPTLGPGQFWGPRGIAIGPDGNVYVTDTGNKRVQVFTPDGQFIAAFGGGGPLDGQMDEPVGIAIAEDGTIYIADTWNQRVQVFSKDRVYLRQWKVEMGWMDSSGETQGIDNKPYIAVDKQGRVYITDPQQYRVIVYRNDGTELLNFGNYGPEPNNFALPTGIAVDKDGNIYVADTDNHKIMKFGPIQ